ncbi:MAG: hypothetical protein ACE5HT_04360 [Gemmatimonadales bacterium]
MPIAAKFSKEFYAKLGHGIADELVDWFNKVDTTYRSEFRELFEVNFARFDAKLEQRVVQVEAKLEQRLAQFEAKLEQRLAQFEAKIEQRLVQFEAKVERRLGEIKAELDSRLSGLESRLIRWMFLFWVGTLGTVIALLKL